MEWISVKDRLPEPDQHILCWDSSLKEWCIATMDAAGLPLDIWGVGWDYKSNVTHWMPLPDPPNEAKE